MINIIIPHFNKPDLTLKLVNSIHQHCSSHEIVIQVIDDGSPIPLEPNDLFMLSRVDENMGFLYASLLGLYVSKGDIKILMNNDVEVSGDFIPPVEEQIKRAGMSLVGNSLLKHDTGWNTFAGRIFPYLEGYFMAGSAEFWEEVKFDTRFAPMDFEDVDLSTQAYSNGYPVVSINSPFLKHLGALTYGYSSQREAITKMNKVKFEDKWLKGL
jgi:GT2 family glycosyltransferase